MIAVVIPAHNEAQYIGTCIRSLQRASRCPDLAGEPVAIVVVLDACTDATARTAQGLGVTTLSCEARNVGRARALGAQWAIEHGARWLAFTDADSVVAPDWIAEQLARRSEVVCGTVSVDDWSGYGDHMARHFHATYTDADGHRHVHGANLGVCARAYARAGGFRPLANHEDVALVAALMDCGASIAWSAAPRVVTSARREFRATGGFGATLAQVDAQAVPAGEAT